MGLRAGARQLVRHPDPEITAAQRQAAENILKLFSKNHSGFRSQSQVETTGALRLLLQDCAPPEAQADLQLAGLRRLHLLLVQAQARYLDILRQEQRAEAGQGDEVRAGEESSESAPTAAPGEPTPVSGASPSKAAAPRRVREIKNALADCFELVFANLAFLAEANHEPYGKLLGQCTQLTAEVNSVVKLRDTREKKAEAKKLLAATAQPAASRVATPATTNTARLVNGSAAAVTVASEGPELAG